MSTSPLGVRELVEQHRHGTSVVDTISATLDRIDRANPTLACFLSILREDALERARELDARGPTVDQTLFGVPVALKSNLCLQGVESNCGSRVLAGYRAPYTATCVQRLIDAGAVIVGMTHLDEFAMGSSGENSSYGPCPNPWDTTRTPGGSSTGSAVAVAAGLVPLALGSDTGGSVRQPAALCGVSGFKPTYGRVSRYGLIAFGSSLDQVSPFARDVRDLELALSVLSGTDPLDSTTLPFEPVPVPAEDERDVRQAPLEGLRVGVPAEYFSEGLEEGVRTAVEGAIAKLEALGAERVEVTLPHTRVATATYYVIATAEASSNLARYDGVRYGPRSDGDGSLRGMIAATREDGFGDEVKRRILLGTYVLSSGYYDAWYRRALRVRRRVRDDFDRAFEAVDVLACPTTPTPAFELGEKSGDPLAMYMSDALTTPASLAGVPSLSVPCGLASGGPAGLPVGMQLIGPAREDARVLRVGRVYQAHTEHHEARPQEVPA